MQLARDAGLDPCRLRAGGSTNPKISGSFSLSPRLPVFSSAFFALPLPFAL